MSPTSRVVQVHAHHPARLGSHHLPIPPLGFHPSARPSTPTPHTGVLPTCPCPYSASICLLATCCASPDPFLQACPPVAPDCPFCSLLSPWVTAGLFPGLTPSARLSGSRPPWPAPLGSGSQAWTQPPGPAQPAAITALVTGPWVQSIGHLLQTRAPGSVVATPAHTQLSQRNPHPLSQPVVRRLWLRQVHSHVLFHAPMLCESERRCPAPRDSGCEPTPAHPQMGWVSQSLRAWVCVHLVGGEGGLML